MTSTKYASWLFIFLISLAALGGYFASSSVFKLDEKLLANSTDTIIHNLTVRQFNEQGQMVNFMETPFMQHVPAHNIYLLKTPHIIFQQAEDSSWEIWSKTAKAINGAEKIIFKNQVKIHQNQSGAHPENNMQTEELTYFPKSKFATTTTEVIFTQPGTVIRSKGMNAYLEEKRVQLLSQAEAVYDAPKT